MALHSGHNGHSRNQSLSPPDKTLLTLDILTRQYLRFAYNRAHFETQKNLLDKDKDALRGIFSGWFPQTHHNPLHLDRATSEDYYNTCNSALYQIMASAVTACAGQAAIIPSLAAKIGRLKETLASGWGSDTNMEALLDAYVIVAQRAVEKHPALDQPANGSNNPNMALALEAVTQARSKQPV